MPLRVHRGPKSYTRHMRPSTNSNQPVFIVGCSRTGSTLLQEILDHYSPVDMLPEAHFLTPLWIHKDVRYALRRINGNYSISFAEDFLDIMYSKKLFGVFWQEIIKTKIDRNILKNKLLTNGLSLQGVFHSVLEAHADENKKAILGAKFPVYICYAEKLTEWYPNCRIIHTIRDPRAIFASQYYKKRSNESSIVRHAVEWIAQFTHISSQYFWAFRTHIKMKTKKSYYLCRYEDLVSSPEKTLNEICDFLAIPFDSRMLHPRAVLNTSFVKERKISKHFKTNSINQWKKKLSKPVSKAIEIMCSLGMKAFGYTHK